MKIRSLFLLTILIICCGSCKKDKQELVYPYFKVTRDGKVTESYISDSRYSPGIKFFRLRGDKSYDNINENEGCQLSFYIPDGFKSGQIKLHGAWYYTLDYVGFDPRGPNWYMDTTINNYIIINSLDTLAKKISGSFSVRLTFPGNKDDVVHLSGLFNIHYVKY